MSRTLISAQISLIREFLKETFLDYDYENPHPFLHLNAGANTGKTDHLAPYFLREAKSLMSDDHSELCYIGGNSKSINQFQHNNELKGVKIVTYDTSISTLEMLAPKSIVVLDDWTDNLKYRPNISAKILDILREKQVTVLALG